MNFSLFIFGTPNGYNQYPASTNSELFNKFVRNRQSDLELIIYRKDRLIYYTYIRYNLLSKTGNEGAYLGMCLVFNSVCFRDVKSILKIFDDLFVLLVSKGEIIKQGLTEKITFTVDTFYEKPELIDGCRNYLHRNIVNHFSRKNIDYVEIDSSFKQTDPAVRTLLINNENSDIFDMVRRYQHIILTSQHISSLKIKKSKRIIWITSFLVISLIIIISVMSIGIDNKQKLSGQYYGKYIENIIDTTSVQLKIYNLKEKNQLQYFSYSSLIIGQKAIANSTGFYNEKDSSIYFENLGKGKIKLLKGQVTIMSTEKKWYLFK